MSKQEFHKTGMTPSQAEEILTIAKGSVEVLLQLEALSKSIMSELKDNTYSTEYQLAKLANYYAMDQANIADSMIEILERGEVKYSLKND